ncbi:adenine deaminase C-terminal domain-containing protein [Niallia sp. NCCP-28]|uniref:adenine deaminase C-terminal domain-containing protein n=1 Tax=Niallia sp. NCCP-28 TaxID=2934712 RepID=UPI002087B84D|nr:adenine deaminase C-terminal domain-containing protein [Niallia sp. NCCP-28]GKU84511.1 putative adenine deaminase [Niallia sp. NCCP-28]
MLDQRYRWKSKILRKHVAVLNGEKSPTIILQNATYLNQTLRKWIVANIWILEDRIVYVGKDMPKIIAQCEIVDCENQFLVPGYIEAHAHPFQIYNPLTLAQYTSQFGTTTLVNDNLMLAMHLDKKKAFTLMGFMQDIPSTIYWWCRYDSQTELQNEEMVFSHSNVKNWIQHDAVLQGGELTAWPKLLDGDDMMLHWMQETKRMRKKIEGHFPGASEKTLAKMMLLGVDSDHEAMTGKEVLDRLLQGYMVSLRYSSIRPDLPKLLDEIHHLGIDQYDKFMLTTDGSPSYFYEQGHIDYLIRIALEKGVPVVDAYNMATSNIAKYYHLEHLHGNIATGRVANINFLANEKNPTPISVLAKGVWVKRNGKEVEGIYPTIDWKDCGLNPIQINWDLSYNDMQFSMPFGIKMENSVITKPYSISMNVSDNKLSEEHDECFFMLLDRQGKWRINTLLKGFSNAIGGLASSYTGDGNIILLGKDQCDMIKAFNRLKEIGGGIVLIKDGKILIELSLPLKGLMADIPLMSLIKKEKDLIKIIKELGFAYEDPIYTLAFFSATHLPYIRITQKGLYDVLNKNVLFPAIMR